MKVKIIKGTNQIGGAITLIESKNKKIIIDFGEDLPTEEQSITEVPMIEGLTTGKSIVDAVFITHSHGDHIGLINYINNDIPIYVEEKSMSIYELTMDFTSKYQEKRKTNSFEFGGSIMIGDIKVTPYRVDHSAYNSAMFLIECEDKRILHMGDFRMHGRKEEEFLDNLYEIGKEKIDLLITEGTCFSRDNTKYQTENGLEVEATELFKNYNQVFVLQSSTNIDRIVSFYKAATRSKKKFVEDLFTATITTNLSKKIPNPINFWNVSVWVPKYYDEYKSLEFKEKYIIPMEKYKRNSDFHGDYCFFVKQSMLSDIRHLKNLKYINKACLVYSMWDGYKEKSDMKKFLDSVESLGIEIKMLHTSGHADYEAMYLVNLIISPDKVIPIHTTNKDKAKEIFSNAIILDDNEEIEI